MILRLNPPSINPDEALQRTLFRVCAPTPDHLPRPNHDRLKRVARPRWSVHSTLKKPIIWVHGDNLNQQARAFTLYPNAPAVFVFDRPTLKLYDLSLKRVLFLYESLLRVAC
jgi:hypothetical protein